MAKKNGMLVYHYNPNAQMLKQVWTGWVTGEYNRCPLSFIDVKQQDYIDGILDVYELNNSRKLSEVFVNAYEKSTNRYSATRQSLGEPNVFRLQNRTHILETIQRIIINRLDQQAATQFIHQHALQLKKKGDQEQFREIIETELLSLHEGNFVRYRVTPLEFESWFSNWSKAV